MRSRRRWTLAGGWIAAAAVAFAGVRSDDPTREAAGAVALVLLLGVLLVLLFRARRNVPE